MKDDLSRIRSETMHRELRVEDRGIDRDKRTVELSFSSEQPVERWFGLEILDHTPGAAELSRLNDGAALLVNHDPNQHIGVIENARIDPDRRGRATVRFGQSDAAKAIFQDVADGIRRLVSVGYRILDAKKQTRAKDKPKEAPDEWRVTQWEPLEISLASVPADASVGVGRAHESDLSMKILRESNPPEGGGGASAPTQTTQPINVQTIREDIMRAERQRRSDISAACKLIERTVPKAKEIAERAIDEGWPLDEYRRQVFAAAPNVTPVAPNESGEIGMNERETKQWSLVRAINACANGGLKSGIEFEASQAFAKRIGKDPQSFWIPPDVMRRTNWQRDQIAATASLGGNLVEDTFRASDFITGLRNRMVVAQLGARMLDGLVGDIVIPRQSGSATAFWVAETAGTTESTGTYDQVTMTPKNVSAWVQLSRQLLIQSTPSIEALVRDDVTQLLAIAQDAAAINGTGTTQPTGIINLTGTGSFTLGAAGAALAISNAWPMLVELEQEVAIDNADIGSLAYLTNPKVRGDLKQIEKSTNTGIYAWQDIPFQNAPGQGLLNGYRASITNQVPSNLTKGTSTTICSALIFGNFNDCLIGTWSGIDILVDPYTNGSARLINVYANLFTDIVFRHPESFATCEDILA